MEMELVEALRIVLDLAQQNAIDPDDCDDPQEAERQDAAIETVRIHMEAM